jgi:hypothetical protein
VVLALVECLGGILTESLQRFFSQYCLIYVNRRKTLEPGFFL